MINKEDYKKLYNVYSYDLNRWEYKVDEVAYLVHNGEVVASGKFVSPYF